MRDSSRSHGFMKTGSGKLASSLRSIHPQTRVGTRSVDGGDDSHVRAMWDEEFLGHDLPPNYVISREVSDEHHSKRKDSVSSRRDLTELSPREQAMWDEEFLGHELPSNYRISREKTADDLTRRKVWDSNSRRGPKKSNSGEKTSSKGGAHRHARFLSEDAFEYHFDRTVDTYVLRDKKPANSRENGVSNLDSAGGGRDRSARPKGESCRKEETFEERALRFGVEDWNLVGKKWSRTTESRTESKSTRRSSRRGIYHSPSGSDTSSLVSTLESSSFSCGSEGSSFAKGDYTATGYCQSNGYSVSTVRMPMSAITRPSGDENGGAEQVTDDGQFVELTLLNRSQPDAPDSEAKESNGEQGNGNFLEFNFLDGRMVESPDDEDLEAAEGNVQRERFSIRLRDEDASSDELAERSAATPTVYQSATTQSPESESFFGSSHDSDWSGTQSVSTEQGGPIDGRDAGDHGDVDDDASVYTGDRTEEWSGEAQFLDANSSSASKKKASYSKEHIQLYPEDRMASVNGGKQSREVLRSLGKSTSPDKRNLKASLTQGTSRRARSLGSVLSQHLAFTAIPSLRHKSQLARGSDKKHYPWVDGDSPAKVSAACIEWLWAEKGHMKPVQSLRSLAAKERELAETRENLAKAADNSGTAAVSDPGPPVRNLEAAFKEGKASSAVLRKAQSNIEKSVSADVPSSRPARSSASPVRVAWRDPSKESRASILASWAAVYGFAESSAEKIKSQSQGAKVSLLSTSSKKVRSGTPVKRTSGNGGCASPRPPVKGRSRLSRHVPKNLALELEVLCRPFGPVLKGVRCLPTTKRGQGGRPSLFPSQAGDFVALEASSSSSSSIQVASSTLQCGRLQCVVTRDGLPSYSLIMDESEEIFVAKTQRVDGGLSEGVTHLYTFHSYKGKGKNKITHWKQWGKKDKPCSDFAGNMKVTSTISPMVSCSGVQTFVESEFVLLDAKVKEVSVSVPTSNSYPRSSFSSWDATPLRSPRLPSSTFSSPSSTYFSLPSPAGAAFGAEGGPGPMPALMLPSSRYVSQSMPSAAVSSRPSACGSGSGLDKSSSSLDKGMLRLRQLERHVTLSSPLQYNSKVGYSESWSDTETLDDTESRITRFLPQSQSELAAVVVRAPMGREQDKSSLVCDKWGWGINFLKKGSTPEKQKAGNGASLCLVSAIEKHSSNQDSGVVRGSSDVGSITAGDAAESCSGGSSRDQVCGSCGNIPVNDRCKGGMSVTLVLPAGNHGCSANGVDGPQPLVERWRSGGKCDCGSWDLGCGLTVLGNQRMELPDTPAGAANDTEPQDNSLRLYIQGKKQEIMGLTLTALREGCYTLGFQASISPLHAFATAVAVLHSRDPLNATKTVEDAKRRAASRAPAKATSCTTTTSSNTTITTTSRSVATRPSEDTLSIKPSVSYQLMCPDPPLSPFGRA